jgi:hypothetical protein
VLQFERSLTAIALQTVLTCVDTLGQLRGCLIERGGVCFGKVTAMQCDVLQGNLFLLMKGSVILSVVSFFQCGCDKTVSGVDSMSIETGLILSGILVGGFRPLKKPWDIWVPTWKLFIVIVLNFMMARRGCVCVCVCVCVCCC